MVFDTSALEASLEEKKLNFLNDVESSVDSFVRSQGKQCIAVVEKVPRSDGAVDTITHELHSEDADKFIKILVYFMRRKPFRGHELDSALTQPIIGLVEEKYVELFEGEQTAITTAVIRAIKIDQALQRRLMENVCEKIGHKVVSKIRKEAAQRLAENMQDALSSQTTTIISAHVTHVGHTVAAGSVASAATHTVAFAIAHYVPMLIAKLLASAAFKKILVVVLHKFIVGLITAVVAKTLATMLGGLSASTVLWILAPILLGILARQIYVFPRKLGREISAALRSELEREFGETNRDILQGIYKDLTSGTKLAQALAEDEKVQSLVMKLICEV